MASEPTQKAAPGARKRATSPARAGDAYAPRPETMAEQALFLKSYSECGVITQAAAAAQIDRRRHYEWLDDPKKYPDYPERFADAHEKACDRLEAEATRRGVEGWEEPVFGSGGRGAGTVEIGAIRKYSDRMLEIMLKARRPDRFRERQSVEHTGKGGGPIETRDVTKRLTTDTLRRVLAELDADASASE